MMKSIVVGVGSLILIVAMIGGFVGYHFLHTKPSDNPTEVVFEIPQGKSFQKVAKELEDARLIQNANLFSWYARLKAQGNKMKVGEYALRRDMSPSEVLAVIISGKSIGHEFTISEGLNMFEIAELYESEAYGKREDFLNLCKDKELITSLLGESHESLEGYLYPETYQLTKFTTTKELVVSMIRKFQEVYKEVAARNKMKNLSKHQIVTLASIIEKETGAPEERSLISSIFHNRLAKGMLLQTDPTIIYGLAEASGKTVYKIGRENLLKPTRYNTYVIKGLPPGPIANPAITMLKLLKCPS